MIALILPFLLASTTLADNPGKGICAAGATIGCGVVCAVPEPAEPAACGACIAAASAACSKAPMTAAPIRKEAIGSSIVRKIWASGKPFCYDDGRICVTENDAITYGKIAKGKCDASNEGESLCVGENIIATCQNTFWVPDFHCSGEAKCQDSQIQWRSSAPFSNAKCA